MFPSSKCGFIIFTSVRDGLSFSTVLHSVEVGRKWVWRPYSVLPVSLSAAMTTLHSVKEMPVSFLSKGAAESDFREIRDKCDDKEREDINDKWSSARALSRTKHMDCLSFLWNSSHMKT